MIGMFGGIAHAPLAVMLMVAEMSGNLSLLAPAMIVVAISTSITGNNTIYRSQIPDRASSPAHRVRMSFPLLSSLLVRDAVTPCRTVYEQIPIAGAIPILDNDPDSGLVLLNGSGEFAGIVNPKELESPESLASAKISEITITDPVVVKLDDRMDIALEQLTARGLSWAPVLDGNTVVGKLTVKNAFATYRDTLERSVRRTNSLPGSTVLFEAHLQPSSPLVGKTLGSAGFPPNTLVVSIMRESGAVFPRGATRLEPGDVVVMVTDGITEARANAEKLFGLEGVEQYLSHATSASPDEIADGLLSAAKTHAKGEMKDDVAIIVVSLRSGEG
jgi:CIC family chloride channel protein